MTDSPTLPGAASSDPDRDPAQRIAEQAARVWEALAGELVPLIGERGFSILFARCVYLTRADHPWLVLDPLARGTARFTGLADMLAGRSAGDAQAASAALLATFHATLAALIGAPLAHAILRTVTDGGPPPIEEIAS